MCTTTTATRKCRIDISDVEATPAIQTEALPLPNRKTYRDKRQF